MARPTYAIQALVLRHTKLKEIDTILTLLTSQGAKQSVVARGLRKPGSRFGGRLEMFCLSQIFLTKGGKLDTVNDVKLLEAHHHLRSPICELSFAAQAVCELADKLSYEELNEASLFPMTTKVLQALNHTPIRTQHEHERRMQIGLLISAYTLKATALMGWLPSLVSCASCGTPIALQKEKAAPTQWFSMSEGGCICSTCLTSMNEISQIDTAIISWLHYLLYTPFDQLVLQDISQESLMAVISLVYEWAQVQLDTRLCALAFLIDTLKVSGDEYVHTVTVQ